MPQWPATVRELRAVVGERFGYEQVFLNLLDKAEQMKASVRTKVEHPFRVIKWQFGFTKVRYKGLAKNTAQLVTLFALSNL